MLSEEQVFNRFCESHEEEINAFTEAVTAYVAKGLEEGHNYIIIGLQLKPTVLNTEEKTAVASLEVSSRGFETYNRLTDFYYEHRFEKEWRNNLMFDLTSGEPVEVRV